jgi:hypothetical protein
MAEEPAMDFEGGAAAGFDAEDNLSMPLGDFMAFLDSGEPGDDDQHPEVRRFTPPAPAFRFALIRRAFRRAGSPIR